MLKSKKILFLGPKPPPVSGFANISVRLAVLLQDQGHKVMHIGTGPKALSKAYPGIVWRVARFIYFCLYVMPVFLWLLPKCDLIYFKVNGGAALFFDNILVSISKLFKKTLFFHHHSFSYLNDFSRLASLAFRKGGSEATHVVNCKCMKEKLESIYQLTGQAIWVSNVNILQSKVSPMLVDRFDRPDKLDKPLVVGFMGYYSYEKGVDLFCETIAAAKDSGISINGVAVGIIHDKEFYNRILNEYGDIISFLEPKFGEEKDQFFEDLDFLMFPSRYRTEAEPLIIYDALSVGVPVFGTDVGCLSEVLSYYSECQSIPVESYLDRVVDVLGDLAQKTAQQRLDIRKKTYADHLEKSRINKDRFDKYLQRIAV